MVSRAELLLNARERLGGVDAAAEAALDVVAILRLVLVGAQARAQRVRDFDHAVFSRHSGAADGQIVRADDLGRQELCEQRRPFVAEVKVKGLFLVHRAVELQIFLEGCAHGGLQLRRAQRAGAGKRRGKPLFPRGKQRRLLRKHRFPPRRLERVDKLIFLHPLLARKLIFRGEEFLCMAAAQLGEHGTHRQLLLIGCVFKCQPRKLVKNALARVTRPGGKKLEPFGLEMWPDATNGKDLDYPRETPIASLPALYYISEKDRSLNMDSTNFAKEHKDAYESIKTKHARIYTIPSKVNNETWFNTLLHWVAPEGQDAYELPVRAFRPTQEEGKVKSYQELQTWNDNHIRKK